MLNRLKRTVELVNQLVASKQNLADRLVEKGEDVSLNTPFDELTQKAGDYVPKTYVLVDQNGKEVVATYVDEETIFDATENDVREGKVFANETGVVTGTKVIPAYYVHAGYKLIPSGVAVTISLPIAECHNFTRLQAMMCRYNSNITSSVAVDKIVIESEVYPVQSATPIATVTKDVQNKVINFGITNDSGNLYLLRYFTYKEIY